MTSKNSKNDTAVTSQVHIFKDLEDELTQADRITNSLNMNNHNLILELSQKVSDVEQIPADVVSTFIEQQIEEPEQLKASLIDLLTSQNDKISSIRKTVSQL